MVRADTRPPPRRLPIVPALLAAVLVLLDCPKPLHIDDTAYHAYAAQIARHPLDPYGFDIFWYEWPQPANTVLAPPVLPYWLAGCITLFGERPFLWKLGLFPFAFLFVGSLGRLLRRFARGLEAPLLAMTVLSPAFLPGLNLMLDVPALGLSLTALVVFIRSCDTGSLAQAALAGLVAGLAMQTKYTGFLAPAAMLLYALLGRHARSRPLATWLVAAGVSATLFVSWETFVALRYEEGSHFLYHLRTSQEPLRDKLGRGLVPLLTLLGGAAPALACLGLLPLTKGWKSLAAAGAAVPATVAVIAATGFSVTLPTGGISADLPPLVLTPGQGLFTVLGAFVTSLVVVAARRLLHAGRPGWWRAAARRRHGDAWFLAAWLALEVAGYFLLTPFLAVRRIMGVVVVATLLLGRWASRTARGRHRPSPATSSADPPGPRNARAWAVAAGSALLGLGYAAVDFREAQARQEAAQQAPAYVRGQDPNATIFFAGHWGFQYYAEQAGMTAVNPHSTRLRPGDWLVVPDASIHQQDVWVDPEKTVRERALLLTDRIPWRTVAVYYGSVNGVPLEHHAGPRVRVDIYRVTAPFTPSPKTPD